MNSSLPHLFGYRSRDHDTCHCSFDNVVSGDSSPGTVLILESCLPGIKIVLIPKLLHWSIMLTLGPADLSLNPHPPQDHVCGLRPRRYHRRHPLFSTSELRHWIFSNLQGIISGVREKSGGLQLQSLAPTSSSRTGYEVTCQGRGPQVYHQEAYGQGRG